MTKQYVYEILKNKGEVLKKFVERKTMMENFNCHKIKTLSTNNGEEYTSRKFEDYLRKKGVRNERTVPKTPEQNRVADRMNRALVETVRAILSDSKLPKKFGTEALSTVSYVRNRSPSSVVQVMTPYEVWKGYKPNAKHLCIFGCSAYVQIPKDGRSKMDPKAKKSIFLGYGIVYRLFDTETLRVFHSRDLLFNDSVSIGELGREGVGN